MTHRACDRNVGAVETGETVDRARTDALVEVFVGTPGLGASRLRAVKRGSERPLDETLGLLAAGDTSCFPRQRLRGDGWDHLARCFRQVCASGIPPAQTRWWLAGDPGWDSAFGSDDDPPAALSYIGSLDSLSMPRVAIVGTRSASAAGLGFARELGIALGTAGVAVVSGLARGIDGAAHRGVLAADQRGRAIGVLGTGLGVVYPREHRELQQTVAERGLVLSEYDFRRGPRTESFPARNCIVAQLAQVVVVVESGDRGGSLLTANEAALRGRPILAVPNNPLVRSGSGTNALLRPSNGEAAVALPCYGPADVLALLDLAMCAARVDDDPRPEPDAVAQRVLNELGWDERTTSWLAGATSLALPAVVRVLAQLEVEGWIVHRSGRWQRRSQ